MTGNANLAELLLFVFLATPIGVAAYMFWLAWTRGGDPEQDAMTVQYEPPNGLSPAECGTLLDNAVGLRCITATITDLSVQGYLSIEQKVIDDSNADHVDYIFHLTKSLTELGNLKPHEREVMTSLFMPANPLLLMSQALKGLEQARVASGNKMLDSLGSQMLASELSRVGAKVQEASDHYRAVSGASEGMQDSVALSDLQDQYFSLRLQRIRDSIFDRLVREGYYANRPDRVRLLYTAKGILLGLGMAIAGAFLASMTRMPPLALVLVGLFTGALVVGFGFFLPARTIAGARMLAKVFGFREFLSRVEKDHIERLEKTPELFEKYLPYAMALAVENRWTEAFGNITVPPPRWYQGKPGGGFLPMHLTSDLNRMTSQTESALAPSPGPAGLADASSNSTVS